MMIFMYHMEGRFPSNGVHQKQYFRESTPQPVMCGAMDVYSMRYGVLDTNLLKATRLKRSVSLSLKKMGIV